MIDLFEGKILQAQSASSKAINNTILLTQDQVRGFKIELRKLEEIRASISINLDDTPFANETISGGVGLNLTLPLIIGGIAVLLLLAKK